MTAPYEVRPIDDWPGKLTSYRRDAPFRATLGVTHRELTSELSKLGAKDVVLEIAISPLDLRLDGRLRAGARPEHPGVILAFASRKGHLRFACDRYRDWADNLRAISRTLNALRSVDRWGAVQDAEQYKGWERLPAPGTGKQAAAAFLIEHGHPGASDPTYAAQRLIEDADTRERIFRKAAKNLHPDAGGDPAQFQRLIEARRVLEGATQ